MADKASWFVARGTETLYLDDSKERWIEVKKRLSYGEQKRLEASAFTHLRANGADPGDALYGLALDRYHVERVLAYVVGWNAVDEDGRKVEITRATVEALDEEVADAINAALDAWVGALTEAKLDPKAPTTSASGTART